MAALARDVASRRPVGRGPRFELPADGAAARAGRPVAGLRCGDARPRFGVHIEIFAREHVLLIPAGVGVATPRLRRGAYVLGGRCAYPLFTREPTGLVEVSPAPAGPARTLGQFFALWGQRLAPRRLGAFTGAVRAYVDGRPEPGDPRALPLARHAQITLEVQGAVPPHTSYLFPPGL